MSKITVEGALLNQFEGLTVVAEVCDPSGRLLGRFVPHIDLSEWEPISPDVGEEELERRGKETESFSTAEVLAYLERLPCSKSAGNGPP